GLLQYGVEERVPGCDEVGAGGAREGDAVTVEAHPLVTALHDTAESPPEATRVAEHCGDVGDLVPAALPGSEMAPEAVEGVLEESPYVVRVQPSGLGLLH